MGAVVHMGVGTTQGAAATEVTDQLLPGGLIHLTPTSSNCIKPDGLLEFAKRLERWGRGAFGHLRLFQNWLDQDAVTAREAIRRLRATCHVVSDSWDSSQAFADYVSTM